MITIIYRISDRLIAGSIADRHDSDITLVALSTEIDNICASELGGVASDYTTMRVNDEDFRVPGHYPIIDEGGNLRQIPNIDAARSSVITKLSAIGLDDAEILAVLNP